MNANSTGIILDLHQVIDVSEEGMSFQSSGPMEVGEVLNFSVDLSDPKTYIRTSGRVVWSSPSGRTGVRFQKTPLADAVKLREWLFANAPAVTEVVGEATQLVEAPTPIDSYAEAPEKAPVADEVVKAEPHLPFRPDLSGLLATEAVKQEVESLAFDLESALQIVVLRALPLTRATGVAIALADADEMICKATSGPDAPPIGARLQVGSGFSGECVRSGQLLHCSDSELDERVDRESCRALGIRSIMAAPIQSSEAVIGLIEIFSSDPGAFSDADKTVLQGMAEIVLAAVKRAVHAVGTVGGRPPFQTHPEPKFAALLEPAHHETEELIQTLAESPAHPPWNGPVQTSLFRRRFKLLIVLLVVVLTAILGLWVVVAGWPGKGSNSQLPTTEQSQPVDREASLAGSSLEDLNGLAAKGDALAEFTLGLRYATGSDAPQDYTEAVRWFRAAAERGHVMAQSTLGAYYGAGRGVRQDFRKAYFWALLAQSSGDDASRARLPFLVSRLNRVDLLEIQQKADDWMKLHRIPSKPTPRRK